MSEISLGTLYEINKNVISANAEPINKPKLAKAKKELEEWFNWQIDGYAMLLCRERYDFTVFHLYEKENPNPPQVATEELIDCLKNRGKIISISKDEENKFEIWLLIDGQAFLYYLFGCDDWVIEC